MSCVLAGYQRRQFILQVNLQLIPTATITAMSQQLSSSRTHLLSIPLKRSLIQHSHTQNDPFQLKSSLSLSRQTQHLSHSTCRSNQQATQRGAEEAFKNENVQLINRRIVEEIDQQFSTSIRPKSKKSFYHSYDQKDDLGSIWLSERKWIPREVQQFYDQILSSVPNQQVNFLQGFLSQIGFMYYVVERNIYFYDIETMHENSVCQNIMQVEKKLVNACYGMQVLNLGQPYISKPRKVLVILQIYQAEFYHLDILLDTTNKGRRIELKSLNLRFALGSMEPKNLVMSRRGYVYYVDEKGGLQQLESSQAGLASNISQLVASSRRFTQQFKDFWVKLAANIGRSIRSYAKAVVNMSKSIFRSSVPESFLVYDPKRNLLIVYQKTKDNRFTNQSLKVYDETTGALLYTIAKQELMQKSCGDDTIINIGVLEQKLNSDYNVVAMLTSGKRIFYDITYEALRKSVAYQNPNPQNKPYSQSSHNLITIESNLLQQTYVAQLMSTSSNFYFYFIREEINSKYEVLYKLDVQTHGSPRQNVQTHGSPRQQTHGSPRQNYYLYSRQLEELGLQKHTLLSIKQQIAPKDMNQEVRQVFYKPEEIIHSTEKLIQRIVILRPIDIFFGVLYSFQNTTVVIKALSILLQSVKKQQLLSYTCQILLDQQGIYYISCKQIAILKAKLSLRMQEYQKRDIKHVLQSVEFREISHNLNKIKDRIHNYIIQTINDQYGLSNEEKDMVMAKGIIKYCSKIMRCVWFTNINDLDRNTCKLIITLIDRFKAQITKLKLALRINTEGPLSYLLNWFQKLKQLMFLTITIAKLPYKTVHEAILTQPSEFHEYIFDFLNKFCKEQIPIELKQKTYIYVNESFTKAFRLWLTFKELKTVEEKLRFLKQQKSEAIPEYLVKVISKERGFADIKLYLKKNKFTSGNIEQLFKDITSYRQILKWVAQSGCGLIEKELLLNKAEEKLEEEAKYNQAQLNEGLVEINDLRAQIKLQKLIKSFYTTNISEQVGWKSRLSRRLNLEETNDESEKGKLTNLLDKFLLDSESLSELVAETKDDYLEIVFVSLFLTDRLIVKIQALIDKTIDSCKNIQELPIKFKDQFRYFLQTANIDMQKQVFVKLYIQKMGNLPALIEIMSTEEGVLEENLYFFLSFIAELKGEPERWFRWANDKLVQLDRNSPYFLYLCACSTYLVRNFLPERRDQMKVMLERGGQNENILKKLIVVVSDTF